MNKPLSEFDPGTTLPAGAMWYPSTGTDCEAPDTERMPASQRPDAPDTERVPSLALRSGLT